MKHNILLPIALIYFFLFSTKCFGQFEINDEDTNFFSVVNKYYSNSTTWSDSAEGGSLSEFKRWENFWLKRIDADGNLNNYVRASHQIVNKRYFHNSLSVVARPIFKKKVCDFLMSGP